MACLAYAIIGIPLNAILIGALGSVFSNKVCKVPRSLICSSIDIIIYFNICGFPRNLQSDTKAFVIKMQQQTYVCLCSLNSTRISYGRRRV